MGKILEKLMKKYWKNVKNTGKVYEKILEKCKKKLEKSGKFVSPKKWEPWYGIAAFQYISTETRRLESCASLYPSEKSLISII